MKQIKLQKIELENFKGIKEFSIELDDNSQIYGANGTGKTTLFDAFTWLLFGKDSSDKKDFQVKTLDANNTVIPKINHRVSAEILVDGRVISLSRILTEKWTKTRGKENTEFTGNQTAFLWNDIEMGAKEYQSKVSEILDENLFKLITSPFAFNKLHWSERRKVLTDIAGDVSNDEIAADNPKFEDLITYCRNYNISIDEHKRQLSGLIKNISTSLNDIPSRIDEVRRNAPEMIDESEVVKQVAEKQKAIDSIDAQISSAAEANKEVNKKIQDNQNKIFELKSEMNSIEFSAKEEAKNAVREFTAASDEISKLQYKVNSMEQKGNAQKLSTANLNDQLKTLVSKKESLVDEWYEVNKRAFDPTASKCPCCNQDVPADEEKFIADKKEVLNGVNLRGKEVASKISIVESQLKDTYDEIEKNKVEVAELKKTIAELEAKSKSEKVPTYEEVYNKIILDSVKYSKLIMEIAALEAIKFEVPATNADLQEKRKQLFDEIVALRESIASNKLVDASNKRVDELRAEEKSLSQQVAKLEKELFIIEQFTKAKIEAVERKVNDKFKIVRFKMFDIQVNGAESETCEILINGVPFSDANTASRINAGVDIINTLSDYYQTSAPIFIDNRESVSELIETDSQVINLIVSPEHKTLTLKSWEKEQHQEIGV